MTQPQDSEPQQLPCAVDGCPNTGLDDSNQYRQSPVLCDQCRTIERTRWNKPRKCSYCNRRRNCQRTLDGNLTCRDCLYDSLAKKEHDRRMAHSHAVKSVTMMFETDGTPHSIRATTFCTWSENADLDMVDGRATYIIRSSHPIPLFYDHNQASCPNCRHNAVRELKLRQEKDDRARQQQQPER